MPPVDNQAKNSVESFVQELLAKNKVVIFSKTTCPWCDKVKELFDEIKEPFVKVELDKIGKLLFIQNLLSIQKNHLFICQ
jgi:hypothetical protein